jgi:hypothetical protein
MGIIRDKLKANLRTNRERNSMLRGRLEIAQKRHREVIKFLMDAYELHDGLARKYQKMGIEGANKKMPAEELSEIWSQFSMHNVISFALADVLRNCGVLIEEPEDAEGIWVYTGN